MARELFETNFVKLKVIGDELNLQPDPFGLVEAAVELVKLGFYVLPYCTEDWILCRRLIDAGCVVLMPWVAPIGTGQGPRNPRALRELRERAPQITLIVDAGIGLPSHACQVMEWRFDGVPQATRMGCNTGGPQRNQYPIVMKKPSWYVITLTPVQNSRDETGMSGLSGTHLR
jgi:thiazole synthase ThiGH ThiG subunit